jgi:hypothetical protein
LRLRRSRSSPPSGGRWPSVSRLPSPLGCQRYERGALCITSNKPFKQWATIFNNDATMASAILDRLLHHGEPVVIEGKSYRMKDRIEPV